MVVQIQVKNFQTFPYLQLLASITFLSVLATVFVPLLTYLLLLFAVHDDKVQSKTHTAA